MTSSKTFMTCCTFAVVFLCCCCNIKQVFSNYQENKKAFVGHYFSGWIPSDGFGCNVSRVQVSEAFTHELPKWLVLNVSNGYIHGVPQESDTGPLNLLITVIGMVNDNMEFICKRSAWKITVETEQNSLAFGLSYELGNETNEGFDRYHLMNVSACCLSKQKIFVATLSISLENTEQARTLAGIAKSMSSILELPTGLIQVIEGKSPRLFFKQLRKLQIVLYENVANSGIEDKLFSVSWPLGCGKTDLDSFSPRSIHKRSTDAVGDSKLRSWHVTSGEIDVGLLTRRRRGIFFGSITALEGTPTETSVLPTRFLSSTVFTSIGSTLSSSRSNQVTSIAVISNLLTTTLVVNSSSSGALTRLSSSISNLDSFTAMISFSKSPRPSVSSSLSDLSSLLNTYSSIVVSETSPSALTSHKGSVSNFTLLPTLPIASSSSVSETLRNSFSEKNSTPSYTVGSIIQSTFDQLTRSTKSLITSTAPSTTTLASSLFGSTLYKTPLLSSYSTPTLQTYPGTILTLITSINSSIEVYSTRLRTSAVSPILSTDIGRISCDPTSCITRPVSTTIPTTILPTRTGTLASDTHILSPFPSSKGISMSLTASDLSSLALSKSLIRSSKINISQPSPPSFITFSSGIPKYSSVISNISRSETSVPQSTLRPSSAFFNRTLSVATGPSLISSFPLYSESRTLNVSRSTSSDISLNVFTSSFRPTINSSLSLLYPPSSSFISRSIATLPSSKSIATIPTVSQGSKFVQSFTEIKSTQKSSNITPTSMHGSPYPSLLSTSILTSYTGVTIGSRLSLYPASSLYSSSISSIYFNSRSSLFPRTADSVSINRSGVPSSFNTQETSVVHFLSIIPTPNQSVTSIFLPTSSLNFSTYSVSSLKKQSFSALLSQTKAITTSQIYFGTTQTQSKPYMTGSPTLLISSTEAAVASRSPTTTIILSVSSPTITLIEISSSSVLASSTVVPETKKVLSTLTNFPSSAAYTNLPTSLGSSYRSFLSTAVRQSTLRLQSNITSLRTSKTFSLTISSVYNATFISSSKITRSSVVSLATSTLVTIPPDSSPILVNSIGGVTAYVGRLLTFNIPYDTFYDREDGWTKNLTLACLYLNGKHIENSFWLRFDNITQTLTGLPFVSNYNSQGYAGVQVQIFARDKFGNIARDVFNVYINNHEVDLQFSISVRISRTYGEFLANSLLKVLLIKRIISFYNTTKAENYYASSLANGSVILSWSDTTITGTTCQNHAITSILRSAQLSSGSITPEFAQSMLPQFPVLGVSLTYLGVCYVPTTTAPNVIGPVSGEKTGDIFVRYVVPTLAVAIVLALIIGSAIFMTKRRRMKPSFFEKSTFKKGQPILLPEEYELDYFNKPAISLPEDYVLDEIKADDLLSEIDLDGSFNVDDDKLVMNPIYGSSRFPNPPPPYPQARTRPVSRESSYESPYSRPPPVYQLPMPYTQPDFMSSEV